jgi:hypothetical protein
MNLDKIIGIIRNLNEEGMMAAGPANNASSGNIAGLPPDQPPVRKRKRERKYMKGPGRKVWMDYLNGK